MSVTLLGKQQLNNISYWLWTKWKHLSWGKRKTTPIQAICDILFATKKSLGSTFIIRIPFNLETLGGGWLWTFEPNEWPLETNFPRNQPLLDIEDVHGNNNLILNLLDVCVFQHNEMPKHSKLEYFRDKLNHYMLEFWPWMMKCISTGSLRS